MPITASPNPVGFWSKTDKGRTAINWSSSPPFRAKVFRFVDGASETQFDGGPNGAFGNIMDDTSLDFGHTYRYDVRRTINNAVIASVTVGTYDIQENLAGTFVNSVIHDALTAPQHIFNLRIVPGIDSVRISFQTAQPTIPVITCEASDGSRTFAFPIFGGMLRKHEGVLGEHTPLQQDTDHSLRIVAAGTDAHGQRVEKVATASFRTGSRHATILFDRIRVLKDSDAGGNGELSLSFGGGDADSGDLMGDPAELKDMDINDDDPPRPLGQSIVISKAPRRLWVNVNAVDDDASVIPGFGGLDVIGMFPSFDGEGSRGMSSDAHDWANVTRVFDIAGITALTELPIELATGDFALAYTVTGRIRVDAFVPAAIESRPPGLGFFVKPSIDLAKSGTAQHAPRPGGGGNGGDEGGYGHFVGLGADGAIYHKPFALRQPATEGEWVRVPGEAKAPVKALTGRDGRLNLFAFDGRGGVLYQKPDSSGGKASWMQLGGRLLGPLAVAEGPAGAIEVFGLGEDGVVHHTSMRADGGGRNRDDWQRIGERVGGSLSAFAFPDGTVGVFALGRDGEVLHKQRRRNRWEPRGLEWHSLGKSAGKRLIVVRPTGEKGIGIATLAEDDSLRYLAWPDYPDGEPPGRWKDAGTIDQWLDSQPPRVRGGGRAAASERGPAARKARSASPPRGRSRANPAGRKPRL